MLIDNLESETLRKDDGTQLCKGRTIVVRSLMRGDVAARSGRNVIAPKCNFIRAFDDLKSIEWLGASPVFPFTFDRFTVWLCGNRSASGKIFAAVLQPIWMNGAQPLLARASVRRYARSQAQARRPIDARTAAKSSLKKFAREARSP